MIEPGDPGPEVSGHGVRPHPEAEILREFSLALRAGAAGEELTQRYLVKHPGHAVVLRRVARDLAGDLDMTRVAGSDPEKTRPTTVEDEERTTPSAARAATAGRSGSFRLSSSRALELPEVDLPEGFPERLGRFRLLHELGRGGMGVVFLAHDEELDRVVAVKTLRADSADHEDAQARFRREQEALISLDHPGIVPVYESGEDQGLLYYAMRHVEGLPLDRWAEKLRSSPAQDDRAMNADIAPLLAAVETVARALHHAHSKGLVHRDVKPANVMIDAEGNALLLDFGLARYVVDETITRSGSLPGTLPYMAPESLANQKIDHRADVYGLGVTLYEGLTGRRPFEGQQPETIMYGILRREAPSPRSLRPELPRDVETVVLKCLEKEPHRRYASAGALADELERILAHRRILAEPVGRLGRAWRLASRNLTISALVFIALAAGFAAIGLVLWSGGEKERWAARRAETLRLEAAELEAEALEIGGRIEAISAEQEHLLASADDATSRAGIVRLQTEKRELGGERNDLLRRALIESDRAFALERRQTDLERSERLSARLEGLLGGRGRLSLVTEPARAGVSLRRYQEGQDGRLVLGPSEDLGRTPIEGRLLDAGSYLLRIEAEGMIAADYPLLIEADEHWGDASFAGGRFARRDWTLRLRAAGDHDPEIWAFVPAGPYLATVPERWPGPEARRDWRWQDDFLIARRETTFGPLIDLLGVPDLRAILRRDLDSRGDSVFLPVASAAGGRQTHRLIVDEASGAIIPGEAQPSLTELRDLPACGLSFFAADNVAGFLSQVEGRELTLPTAGEWEKAARGVDGRAYPWGGTFAWSLVAGRRSLAQPLLAGAVSLPSGSRPGDLSPYGCLDMAGNVREFCLDGPGDQGYWVVGGALSDPDPLDFLAWPMRVAAPADRGDFFGLRLVRR